MAGGCEAHKHSSMAQAAQHELEEEAQLVGGTWHCLLDAEAPADKYSTSPFQFYLVIDPEEERNPKPQDDEELLVVHRGVSGWVGYFLVCESTIYPPTYPLLLS